MSLRNPSDDVQEIAGVKAENGPGISYELAHGFGNRDLEAKRSSS
jgi:hypothetical protein